MILYNWSFVLLAVMNKFLARTHFQFNASVIIITYLNSHLGVRWQTSKAVVLLCLFIHIDNLFTYFEQNNKMMEGNRNFMFILNDKTNKKEVDSKFPQITLNFAREKFFFLSFACLSQNIFIHIHILIICQINALMHQTSRNHQKSPERHCERENWNKNFQKLLRFSLLCTSKTVCGFVFPLFFSPKVDMVYGEFFELRAYTKGHDELRILHFSLFIVTNWKWSFQGICVMAMLMLWQTSWNEIHVCLTVQFGNWKTA